MGHVQAIHLHSAVEAWGQIAELEEQLRRLRAASESEQRHAAASPTSWVFNWRADGWEPGHFASETRDLGEGVTTACKFHSYSTQEVSPASHYIGYTMHLPRGSFVHASISILDKHDKNLLVWDVEPGPATVPFGTYFKALKLPGVFFTPTAEEKALSVRADGSIRIRVALRFSPFIGPPPPRRTARGPWAWSYCRVLGGRGLV